MAQATTAPVSAAAIALGLEDARERASFIRSVVAAQAADPNPYVLATQSGAYAFLGGELCAVTCGGAVVGCVHFLVWSWPALEHC